MKIDVDKAVVNFLFNALWEAKENLRELSEYHEELYRLESEHNAKLLTENDSLRKSQSKTLDELDTLSDKYDKVVSENHDLKLELQYTYAILGEQ